MDIRNFESEFDSIIKELLLLTDIKEVKLYLADLKKDVELSALKLVEESPEQSYNIDADKNLKIQVLEYVFQFIRSVTNNFFDNIIPEELRNFEHFNLDLSMIEKKFNSLNEEIVRLNYIYYIYMYYQICANCRNLNIIKQTEKINTKNLLNFINSNLTYLRDKINILSKSSLTSISTELEDETIENDLAEPDLKTEKITTNLKLQVLVLKYMLTALNYNQDSKKTEIARFISFTTGKSYKNVYDYVLKVFNFVGDENHYITSSEYLHKVEKYFRQVGLNDIAEIVKQDRKLSLFQEEKTQKKKYFKRQSN